LSFAMSVPLRSRYSASAIRLLASIVLSDSQAVQSPESPTADAVFAQMVSAPVRPPRFPLLDPLVTNTWVSVPVGVAVGVADGVVVAVKSA